MVVSQVSLRNGQGPGKGEQVRLREKKTLVCPFLSLKRKTPNPPGFKGILISEKKTKLLKHKRGFFNNSLFIITLGMTLQEYA